MFLLDLSHLLLPFQLGCILSFCLILSFFLLIEVIHEYPDDDHRILRIILPQHLSLIDLQYYFLQFFVASFGEDDDK